MPCQKTWQPGSLWNQVQRQDRKGVPRSWRAATGRIVMVGKTAEGQGRKIAWEVRPVKRALLSVKKMTRAGKMAWFGEDKAFIKILI